MKQVKPTSRLKTKCKVEIKCVCLLYMHTSHTKHTVLDPFNALFFNYSEQKSTKHFAIYDSDIPVTLK